MPQPGKVTADGVGKPVKVGRIPVIATPVAGQGALSAPKEMGKVSTGQRRLGQRATKASVARSSNGRCKLELTGGYASPSVCLVRSEGCEWKPPTVPTPAALRNGAGGLWHRWGSNDWTHSWQRIERESRAPEEAHSGDSRDLLTQAFSSTEQAVCRSALLLRKQILGSLKPC